MLLNKSLPAMGDIKGTIYDFQQTGDILPMHSHTDQDNHITIVCKGAIKAYSKTWERLATAGQILDFVPNEPHELLALEDNTRIINIVKKFQP